MLELLQLKQQLEEKVYKDTNSLFELRLLLMDVASLLTNKHLSNYKHKKDLKASRLLLKSFGNIRGYFHVLETNKREHEQCFNDIKISVITELSGLYTDMDSQQYKIIPISGTHTEFGMAN